MNRAARSVHLPLVGRSTASLFTKRSGGGNQQRTFHFGFQYISLLAHLDADFAKRSALETMAWRDKRRRAVFLDQRGALRFKARRERGPLVDVRGDHVCG